MNSVLTVVRAVSTRVATTPVRIPASATACKSLPIVVTAVEMVLT